jgi:hypothetical protein
MHHRLFCQPWSPTDLADTNGPFFCCHVVEELLVRSIASMFKAHPTARPAGMKFMRQIGRRLRYLPHSIKLKPNPGGILVSWEDNETESCRTFGSSPRTTMLCFMMAIMPTLRWRSSTIK